LIELSAKPVYLGNLSVASRRTGTPAGKEKATSTRLHPKRLHNCPAYRFNASDEDLWELRGDAKMRGSGGKVSSL
jgi:hypothetical protein